MKIIQAKECVKVEECERDFLFQAYDFFEDVYQKCETDELKELAKAICDDLEDFFETFMAE